IAATRQRGRGRPRPTVRLAATGGAGVPAREISTKALSRVDGNTALSLHPERSRRMRPAPAGGLARLLLAGSGGGQVEVDAALRLVEAAPAPRARTLAGLRAAGARHAADRGEAVGLERMARQIVAGEIGLDLTARPAGERIDLHPPVRRLDHRQA